MKQMITTTNDFPWPPDYLNEFTTRNRLLLKLNRDTEARGLMDCWYKENPADWIEDFCITYDPRNIEPMPRLMPTVLFPRQREFINWLHKCYNARVDGLCEKSRDMGASWLSGDYSVWLWKYHPESAIGWGSRKEEYVDKRNDPKAIFPKMRMIIANLPEWQLPEGFNLDDHATKMLITNPENGSTIVGEAGENIGRGGRTSIYFKDESAHYENPESIEAALGDNTNVQIDISSVCGSGTVFYRKRFGGKVYYPGDELERGRTSVFVMDWRDHPGKTQEWFDLRHKKAADSGLLHILAQEVERDYTAAMDKIIIPASWINASVDAHIKLNIPIEGKRFGGQDIADEGGDKNALALRHGILLFHAQDWGGSAEDAADIAVPLCMEHGIQELYYDSNSVGVGFKVKINSLKTLATWPKGLKVLPWNGGGAVLDPEERVIQNDRESPLNKDQYANLKAQSWFRLATRFAKTYRMVHEGLVYPHSELISLSSKIPKLEELKRELSQAIRKSRPNGQTLVDKKPKGTHSPNLADAVVQCYNPVRELSILDVL